MLICRVCCEVWDPFNGLDVLLLCSLGKLQFVTTPEPNVARTVDNYGRAGQMLHECTTQRKL